MYKDKAHWKGKTENNTFTVNKSKNGKVGVPSREGKANIG